ncbi:hypothetical protein M2283_007613 [Streptomyces pseudovenezuelae]|uniref:Uncharacterized protein n=2 Tax=Streptomyces pseudovenezuelae TaxID=67350 RepID=A0ABT6LVN0_9ACTN|nr:hypothetical protein [Streptomyces pseudovenezuelae]
MSASVSLAMTQLVPLAEVDENKVTPGVLGFIVFAAMALAVWVLMKSMSKHMGKVDFKEKDTRGGEAGTAPDDEATVAGTAGKTSGEAKAPQG